MPTPVAGPGTPQRINRILSLAGVASRRTAEDWIVSGRIRVNGRTVREPGARAAWGEDRIQVDGREIPGPTTRIHLMLNKPFGFLCASADPRGRPLVTDLVRHLPYRLYPVGRLDFDSMGLVFLTNDGDWAYRLTHPRHQLPRTYKADVRGALTEEGLRRLGGGVHLSDGPALPAKVTVIRKDADRSLLRLTITQGKNRQVRRMMEAVGLEVVHLIRIGFGPQELGDLKVGAYRLLEAEEVEALRRAVRVK